MPPSMKLIQTHCTQSHKLMVILPQNVCNFTLYSVKRTVQIHLLKQLYPLIVAGAFVPYVTSA